MRRILFAGLAAASLSFAVTIPAQAATTGDCQGENCAPANESSKRGCGHSRATTS